MSNVLILAGVGTGCYIAGLTCKKLFDDGLANTLCVESLRHGTNLLSYMRIQVSGGDPKWTGSAVGSTHGFLGEEVEKNFFVFKDTEYKHYNKKFNLLENIFYASLKWIGPRFHTFLSGYHTINRVFYLSPESNHLAVRCSRVFFGIIGGIVTLVITPILKFRVAEIDSFRFKNDTRYADRAYKTASKLEAWRLGTMGTLLTGLNTDWCNRVKARPLQLATGVLQLITAAALITLGIYYVLPIGYAPAVIFAPFAVGVLLA